jgi:hypothetical protein
MPKYQYGITILLISLIMNSDVAAGTTTSTEVLHRGKVEAGEGKKVVNPHRVETRGFTTKRSQVIT